MSAKVKNQEFNALWEAAYKAGLEAGNATVPVPMVVSQHANPLNDGSPVVKQWYVPSGVCGFAWVKVNPGNSPFANWLKKNGKGRTDSYAGGVSVWIKEFGQSMEQKEAMAYAMAKVFNEAGVKAYGQSRMD